jgi:hypothetical protein
MLEKRLTGLASNRGGKITIGRSKLMNTHIHCLACGSPALFAFPVGPGEHSHLAVGSRVLEMIPIQRYVCTNCGHVEEWVNGEADLQKLTNEHTEQKAHPKRSQPKGSQEAAQM